MKNVLKRQGFGSKSRSKNKVVVLVSQSLTLPLISPKAGEVLQERRYESEATSFCSSEADADADFSLMFQTNLLPICMHLQETFGSSKLRNGIENAPATPINFSASR
ncbi:hypothetical protein SFRURICE_014852 [Spodoptera frugiperda]|nr:hypothetical protein SFRURICE_014852 [Spodoptera frugiperda]